MRWNSCSAATSIVGGGEGPDEDARRGGDKRGVSETVTAPRIAANRKIALLSPSLRGGGVENEMLLLAAELQRRQANVELVLVNSLGSAYAPPSSLRVIDLGARRIRFGLWPLVRYLRQSRPDILWSAETPVNALAIAVRALCGYPRRLIVSEHNHVGEHAGHASRWMDRLRPLIVRWLYPRADSVVAVSRGVAADLAASCGVSARRVHVLYDMLDTRAIAARAQEEVGHPWLRTGEIPVILNVARLSPQKDQATLIRAFAHVRASTACRLLILGEGSERRTLETLARQLGVADDVGLPGFVSNPYAWMSRSRVLVLSSAWEGLPIVLIEALSVGLPVVSTDCPSGPAEILENGRYGLLSPVGDPAALAHAIAQTFDAPTSPALLRKRAKDFSVERLLPEYLRLLAA